MNKQGFETLRLLEDVELTEFRRRWAIRRFHSKFYKIGISHVFDQILVAKNAANVHLSVTKKPNLLRDVISSRKFSRKIKQIQGKIIWKILKTIKSSQKRRKIYMKERELLKIMLINSKCSLNFIGNEIEQKKNL